ncbi:MAG TPA: 5-formyltetrahydrofolate cyclo-ligase [Nitrospirota bacterium]|nr:5-formyltetrahydrofolate cyclo-ligase [Nitrospirota bacterium]
MPPVVKSSLRREILEKRNSLTPEERHVKSEAVAARLKGLPEYRDASVILFYVNFRSEVATRGLIGDALLTGKKTLVPKVDHKTHTLRLFEITDIARDLECGYMGIYEPVEKFARAADPLEADLVVMPGVGFDEKGRRLGYGGGYYDRLVETLKPGAMLAALAFDVQVVGEIPSEGHDKKVDFIITETRVIPA